MLGPRGCSSWGESRGLSAPAGATPARSIPSPGTHPRITHGALIHHVHAAPHAQHPRAGASRHPLTPAPVPEPHPSGSRVFPSSQVLNSLLCSSPRQSIPVQAAAANAASPHCSMQFRQAAAGHGSVRGATNLQMGQPHPDPPKGQLRPDTHTPLLPRSHLPGEEDKGLWYGTAVTQWAREAL